MLWLMSTNSMSGSTAFSDSKLQCDDVFLSNDVFDADLKSRFSLSKRNSIRLSCRLLSTVFTGLLPYFL